MVRRARELADALPGEPVVEGGTSPADVAELLRWLADGHFTFLGYRSYDLVRDDGGRALKAVLASGLGVLRQDSLATRIGETPLAQVHFTVHTDPAASGALPLEAGAAELRTRVRDWLCETSGCG